MATDNCLRPMRRAGGVQFSVIINRAPKAKSVRYLVQEAFTWSLFIFKVPQDWITNNDGQMLPSS